MSPSTRAAFHGLVSRGIPVLYRSTVWDACRKYHASGSTSAAPAPSFSDLVDTPIPAQTAAEIEKDVDRTFPGHSNFSSEKEHSQLQSILTAFAAAHPEIGYCQGLSFLAFSLSLFFSPDQTLDVLSFVVIDILGANYFDSDMKGRFADMLVIQHLTRAQFPRLFFLLEAHEVDVGVATFSWFLVMFAGLFRDMELTFRIWDVVLSEGSPVFLFRVALALIASNEDSLIALLESMGDEEEEEGENVNVNQRLTDLPLQWTDCDALIRSAYKIALPGESAFVSFFAGSAGTKVAFDEEVLRLRARYKEKVEEGGEQEEEGDDSNEEGEGGN
ncbi:hypothetical protein TeGR_g11041 [Tetraparma gracilis]|uniref:Rab-GAP TBC domain-containing protein n=1 Tax=Tetraparma gracilis TaxID=2962635 RepID=A0ABQ6MTR8_9STRA|nr:hypothetical protein TeGR_g11041 [Tetraparma gracilis]